MRGSLSRYSVVSLFDRGGRNGGRALSVINSRGQKHHDSCSERKIAQNNENSDRGFYESIGSRNVHVTSRGRPRDEVPTTPDIFSLEQTGSQKENGPYKE